MSPLIDRYTRRQLPADYDLRGWWSTELQNIQRALKAVGDAVDALLAGGAGGRVTTFSATGASNSTTGSGSAVSTGLTRALAVGESVRCTWSLDIQRNSAPAGAVALWLATVPTADLVRLTFLAPTTGMTNLIYHSPNVIGTGTPALFANNVLQYYTGLSTQSDPISVEVVVQNVTAPGTLDILFAPMAAGDTVTVRAGSRLTVETL